MPSVVPTDLSSRDYDNPPYVIAGSPFRSWRGSPIVIARSPDEIGTTKRSLCESEQEIARPRPDHSDYGHMDKLQAEELYAQD